MKILGILIVVLTVNTAFAEGYYGRFWRGAEKTAYPELRNYCDDRHSDCFLELVNRWLIPATPSYAAKDALRAYVPVLMPKALHKKYKEEVALILYSNEETYRKLRLDKENLEGSTYGPIHGDIFEMGEGGTAESSRSLEPQAYTGDLTLQGDLKEVSFDLLGQKTDLINANAEFVLIEFDEQLNDEIKNRIKAYLNELKLMTSKFDLRGSYVLLTENHMMQYTFTGVESDFYLAKLREKWGLDAKLQIPLKKLNAVQTHPLLYERITYGEGGNLQFTPGVKPGMADHYRLHQEQ